MYLLYCVNCGNPVDASPTSVGLASGCPNCHGKAFTSERPSIFEPVANPMAEPKTDAEPPRRVYDYRKAALQNE